VFHSKPLRPNDLGLILSYQCQCECAHCIYNCGPNWTDWMKPDDIYRAFAIMQVWKKPFQVHLTGGEPFLNFPLLLEAVRIGTDAGIPCYVETNAGWCVREELVKDRLLELRQAGLQTILISCSPFHAEKIPPARTLLAIRICNDIFGPQRTIVYQSEWLDLITSMGFDKTIPLERYIREYGRTQAGHLFWQGFGLISGSRVSYRLGHLIDKHSAVFFQGQTCRGEILYAPHSHFDLFGNYISGFCGGLSVGNWHELPSVLEKFEQQSYPKLIDILIRFGAFGLFEFARDNHGYAEKKEGYVGKCHLCVDVRQHLIQTEDWLELNPEAFYDHNLPEGTC